MKHPTARKILPDRHIYCSRQMPPSAGFPVLCDLDQARIGCEKQHGDIMPGIYRAPEVILDMEWNEKVDIWAVGMTVSYSPFLDQLYLCYYISFLLLFLQVRSTSYEIGKPKVTISANTSGRPDYLRRHGTSSKAARCSLRVETASLATKSTSQKWSPYSVLPLLTFFEEAREVGGILTIEVCPHPPHQIHTYCIQRKQTNKKKKEKKKIENKTHLLISHRNLERNHPHPERNASKSRT